MDMRHLAIVSLVLLSAGSAAAVEWRAAVSHCETDRGKLIARHLQCDRDPLTAPCGKIQAVHDDLGGLARLEVRWQSGSRAEILIGPHQDRFCILAQRFIAGRSMASTQ